MAFAFLPRPRLPRLAVRLTVSLVATLAAGLALAAATPQEGATTSSSIAVSVDAAKTGPTINRQLFGQFAEHLGTGIYEGVWVGPDSPIPNTRGIRNDVVAALRAIKVPNVRWPGGCFADEYHWRNGVGPTRRVTFNPNWGGVIEPNTFGTHEFMDFAEQVGADAFISINVGSGTPQDAAEWMEYMTAPTTTTLGKERAANGREEPWIIPFLGIGNENWDCGGNMSAEYYLQQLRIFARFARNYNPAQQGEGGRRMERVAVGPGGGEPRFVEWTRTIMRSWEGRQWSWDMEALSLHFYSVVRWPPAHVSVGFGESDYAEILAKTLEMNDLIRTHGAIMDTHDPDKRITLAVDEWGAWYAQLPGTTEGFLRQQNSVRDAILAALNLNIFARNADRVRLANIAQMVNVLQAMILTDGPRMLLTPTYHVFKMYLPFQDATFVPVTYDAGRYTHGDFTLPRVDVMAAKDASGTLWLSLTNVDPNRPAAITTTLNGITARSASGETLTGPAIDSVNTFDAPGTVTPTPVQATVNGNRLSLTLAPKSVTVIGVRP
jgi:alpha-L-arabinofuranosidase